MYITTADELKSWCASAATSQILAIDTEFLREKTYFPKLCLIQLATDSETALVDPLALSQEELSPLAALLADEHIVKIFHACTQDLEVLYHGVGALARPIFDTQLAAEFLGSRMQLGYGALVEECCGVRLPKAQSLSDWSARPLSSDELAYAEEDVVYLPQIYHIQMSRLIEANRLSWVEPEMEALCDPTHFMRDPDTAYLHLKRTSGLSRRQLAIAREVAAWRERTAAKRDIPRKWCAADETLTEIARRRPTTPEQLRRIRGTTQLSEGDCEALLLAVERGMACPADELPEPRHHVRLAPETESVVDLTYALLRLIGEREHLAPQLIATREDLAALVCGKADARLRQGWRWELAGSRLSQLLDGKLGLTVKDGHIEIL